LLNGFNFRSVSELWPAEVSELINVMGLIYVLLLVVGAKRGVGQRMLCEELLEGSLHSVVVIELLEPVKVRQLILQRFQVLQYQRAVALRAAVVEPPI
jgi:hypothetical protein